METKPRSYHRLKLLKSMPKSAVCAEIGVWKGKFSKTILEITLPKRLHLIDPWTFQGEFSDRWYSGKRAKNQEDYEYVRKDLELSFHKVKPGGLVTGDDYTWGENDGFPITRAVQDFIEDKKLVHNLELLGSQFIITL